MLSSTKSQPEAEKVSMDTHATGHDGACSKDRVLFPHFWEIINVIVEVGSMTDKW